MADENLKLIWIVSEHSLPLILSLIDFGVSAVLFNPKHGILLVPILLAYYGCNYGVTLYQESAIYKSLKLDWSDYHSLVKVGIHFILTLFIYYLLYLITRFRHDHLIKQSKSKRITLKQEEFQYGLPGQPSFMQK